MKARGSAPNGGSGVGPQSHRASEEQGKRCRSRHQFYIIAEGQIGRRVSLAAATAARHPSTRTCCTPRRPVGGDGSRLPNES